MVEGEGEFETLGRHPAVGEESAGVVDQHVDARFAFSDRRADPARFRHAREIRQVNAMADPRRFGFELAHRRLRAAFVTGDENDASAQASKREDGDFPDAGGRAGGDDGLALHQTILWFPELPPSNGAQAMQKEEARSNASDEGACGPGFRRHSLALW